MTELDEIFPISDSEADALHAKGWNSGYGWATEYDWWRDDPPELDSTKHDLRVALTAIRTALPLRIAASAGWNAKADEFNQWETLSAEEQVAEIDAMRVALLALAEVDLKGPHLLVDEAFKAILRAIATEGNTDV